jgi:hypothetical protein
MIDKVTSSIFPCCCPILYPSTELIFCNRDLSSSQTHAIAPSLSSNDLLRLCLETVHFKLEFFHPGLELLNPFFLLQKLISDGGDFLPKIDFFDISHGFDVVLDSLVEEIVLSEDEAAGNDRKSVFEKFSPSTT